MIARSMSLAPAMSLAITVGTVLISFAGGPAQAQPQNPSFNLVNRSGSTITELYATAPGVSNWGQDRLGDNTVATGDTFPVRLPANGNCRYDIRVVYENGRSEERRNINTCTVDNVTFGQGGSQQGGDDRGTPPAAPRQRQARDLTFTVLNRSETAITAVYASPTGNNNWGQDWLGENGIAFSQRRVIHVPQANGACSYDIRFDYADRSKFEKRNVDLCAESPTLSVN